MDYEQFKVKGFDLWDLYLHQSQFPYLGRCYAAAKRADADLVTDMDPQEAQELFSVIIPSWHKAVVRAYGISRPNVAILGNDWAHLHAHLIPRFAQPKQFYGIEFIDPRPKRNYAPYPKRELSLATLQEIRRDIASHM